MDSHRNVIPQKKEATVFLCPGSAWACPVNEAQPLVRMRPQAEPGDEDAGCLFMVKDAPRTLQEPISQNLID
jgi:hypothetical protein